VAVAPLTADEARAQQRVLEDRFARVLIHHVDAHQARVERVDRVARPDLHERPLLIGERRGSSLVDQIDVDRGLTRATRIDGAAHRRARHFVLDEARLLGLETRRLYRLAVSAHRIAALPPLGLAVVLGHGPRGYTRRHGPR